MNYEELVAKALEEFMDKIKQGFAEESVQMKHVEAMLRDYARPRGKGGSGICPEID